MSAFVVIVTGWRGASVKRHGQVISEALEEFRNMDRRGYSKVVLRHGKCKYGGADLVADGIARQWGWEIDAMPAEELNGRILGPERNRSMCAKQPRADVVVAFPGPGSTGTWNCLHWAQRYGIPFIGVPLGGRTAK